MELRKSLKRAASMGVSVLAGVLIGFTFLFLIDYLTHAGTVSLGAFVLVLLGSLLLSTAVHELAHLIGFRLCGEKIRLILISPFLFQKKNGRWRLTLKVTSTFLIGGIVVPDIRPIENEEELQRFQRRLRRAVLAAPLASAALIVLCWIAFAAARPATVLAQDWWLVCCICLTLVGIMLLASSLVKNDQVIGDLRIGELRNHRPLLVALALQYAACSTDYPREKRAFLQRAAQDCIAAEHPALTTYSRLLLTNQIQAYLLGQEALSPHYPACREALLEHLSTILAEESGFLLANMVLAMKILEEHDRPGAVALFERIFKVVKPRSKAQRYHYQRGLLLCGLDDTRTYLENPRNVASSAGYEAIAFFDYYLEEEQAFNRLAAQAFDSVQTQEE